MQTLKFKYEVSEKDKKIILSYQEQFSHCVHVMYNRLKEEKSQKECRDAAAALKHIELLDSWFRCCAIGEAGLHLENGKKVIFGGKKNFIERAQGKISRDEFLKKRVGPIYICGEATHYHGNRKFSISDDLKTITFKPCKDKHIKLQIPQLRNSQLAIMKRLKFHSRVDDLPITFKLDQEYVYISFDESRVFNNNAPLVPIKDRVFAIDMNPNYIGWSVCDWKKDGESFTCIASGVTSIKELSDKEFALKKLHIASDDPRKEKITRKRNHEVIEIAKFLVEKAKHYRCETFAVEDLVFHHEKQKKKKGEKTLARIIEEKKRKRFNKLVNGMWCRTKFVNNLNKRCNMKGITFMKVLPAYSSFIGNLIYRKLGLPDMVNASLEVSRRAFEFRHQYILKDKTQEKNIVCPPLTPKFKEELVKSLEEFNCTESFKSWPRLFKSLKRLETMYRVPFRGDERWSKLKTEKSNVGFFDCNLCSLQF